MDMRRSVSIFLGIILMFSFCFALQGLTQEAKEAEGTYTIKKGDTVYAKVSTISMRNTIQDIKIALTMRAEGFGKPEWIKEDKLPLDSGRVVIRSE
jgi:DNA-directed RNA polymerase subunit E'/Rpb7